MLLGTIGILAATAEWVCNKDYPSSSYQLLKNLQLVDSIEFVREAGGIQEE